MGLRCLGLLALVLVPRLAVAACEGEPAERMTNYELVERTPNIVAVKVVDERTRHDRVQVELLVTEVVRGATVRVGDRAWIDAAAGVYFGASPAEDFSAPRPGAEQFSDCIAHDFRLGAHYLLFSARFTNTWHRLPHNAPYARVTEEIAPQDDLWLATVRAYARIAALPQREARNAAIDSLIALGSDGSSKGLDRALANDLFLHRRTPTRYKRNDELIALYHRLEPNARDAVLPVLARKGDLAALPIFRAEIGHLTAPLPKDTIASVLALCEYFSHVRDPDAIRSLLAVYLLFEMQNAMRTGSICLRMPLVHTPTSRAALLQLFAARADASHRTTMELLLKVGSDEDAVVLAAYFARHPSAFATREIRRRTGNDFAARPQLAAALASLGERDVLAWGTARVPSSDTAIRSTAIAIVASSPLPGADAIVTAIAARGGEALEQLFAAFERVRHPRALLRFTPLERFNEPPMHFAHYRADRARDAWLRRLDPRELAALYLSLGKTDAERALRYPLLDYIVALDASELPLMERILASTDDGVGGFVLTRWFVGVPSALALANLKRVVGLDYTKSLPKTFALAAMGDRAVLAWALEVLAGTPTAPSHLTAINVIAASPYPEAEALIAGLLEKSGRERMQIIVSAGYLARQVSDERTTKIVHQRNLSEEEQRWLEAANADRVRRGIE